MFANLGRFNKPDTHAGQAFANPPSNWRYHVFSKSTPDIRQMQLSSYKRHAETQSSVAGVLANSKWTVLTLWDYDGVMGEPWARAGYNVIQCDDGDVDVDKDTVYAVITCPVRLGQDEASQDILGEKNKKAFSLISRFCPPIWMFLSHHPIKEVPHGVIILGRDDNQGNVLQSLTGHFPFSISLPEPKLAPESHTGFSYRLFMEANHIDHPRWLLINKYPKLSHRLLTEASIFFDLDDVVNEIDALYEQKRFIECSRIIDRMIENAHIDEG